ncbi:MAG: alpha-L-rhamnosidase-related protein [Acidimicrobiales bacterium]
MTLWPKAWHGRWIWDAEAEPGAFPYARVSDAPSHSVYLRRLFLVEETIASVPARVTCDSRYLLFLNGHQLGRGPVRSEPELLGWDEHDLGPHLVEGPNVIVVLCWYYGTPGPWWLPASRVGTLGSGSFCIETAPGSPLDIDSDPRWRAAPSPWVPNGWGTRHAVAPEVVDGRLVPDGLHDASAPDAAWPACVVVGGRGQGTVLDRPPAPPYSAPLRRPIPQLTSTRRPPRAIIGRDLPVSVELEEDPRATWSRLELLEKGDRRVSVWEMSGLSRGYVRLEVELKEGAGEGMILDVVAGEDLRQDGLPEIRPRAWAARYITSGAARQEVTFFDPVGVRYLAVHHPPGVEVNVELEEAIYPGPEGARFDCDDARYVERWKLGARTVAVCSADAFLDCPGREQRAWVADAYPEILVTLVSSPDWRLVRHHLALTAVSRHRNGLLAGAAACDFARGGMTMPDYSLHWLRSVAAYWRYSGDEKLVERLMPVAEGVIEAYEAQRGPSGLLEDFPGWVFIDWAQVDRDTVTGAHDGLYAAALQDYATLPGATDVAALIESTATAFEALWDAGRGMYVDALGAGGQSRRISQHTNSVALLAGIVPDHRVAGVIARMTDPGPDLGGRLVVTATSASVREKGIIPLFQYLTPAGFDPERDVVAAQPWFCRFLHEALFRYGRRDLILDSLLRWEEDTGRGTFQEFWYADLGTSSRCHGWSASPTYDLTTYILGVRPVEPGYVRAEVDPWLGQLGRVSGRVPTPLGWLSVSIDGKEAAIEVPEGMVVTLDDHEVGPGGHHLSVTRAVSDEPTL